MYFCAASGLFVHVAEGTRPGAKSTAEHLTRKRGLLMLATLLKVTKEELVMLTTSLSVTVEGVVLQTVLLAVKTHTPIVLPTLPEVRNMELVVVLSTSLAVPVEAVVLRTVLLAMQTLNPVVLGNLLEVRKVLTSLTALLAVQVTVLLPMQRASLVVTEEGLVRVVVEEQRVQHGPGKEARQWLIRGNEPNQASGKGSHNDI